MACQYFKINIQNENIVFFVNNHYLCSLQARMVFGQGRQFFKDYNRKIGEIGLPTNFSGNI